MRTLTVGMMQSNYERDYASNIVRIKKDVKQLMRQMNKPELIIGIEYGLGCFDENKQYDTIPGKVTEQLGEIAREYRIYFAPGTMLERRIVDGEERIFNSLPIFNPDGELVKVYRKICPYYPMESFITPGDEYCVLDIKEKDIKVGFMICHDWCFPEVSRNLTLLGAEMLIRIAMDQEELRGNCRHIAEVRAFENQAYFISLNKAGTQSGIHSFGQSVVVGPDGKEMFVAGDGELHMSLTFDMDVVTKTRTYGTNFTEQLLRQLKMWKFDTPDLQALEHYPLFDTIPDPDLTMERRSERLKKDKIESEF